MLKPKIITCFVFVVGLLFAPLVISAEKITKGAMLSITCAGCHGTDGRSDGSIPSIVGKSAEYLNQTMLDYREDKRPSSVMGRHARGYSDDEIKLIADYFASKK